MLDREDLLPEEQASPELLKELQVLYQMHSDEKQLLLRTRVRLAKMSVPLSSDAQGPSAKMQRKASKQARGFPIPATRPWLRSLNTLAAVLIVTLIVSALVLTFSLVRNARVAKDNTSQVATSHEPAPKLIELTEGERLCMVNEKDGWSIGIGSQDAWGSILRTTDGGKSWKLVTPPGIHRVSDLYILDNNTAWLPIWDQTKSPYPVWLYRTINGGTSWQRFTFSGSDIQSLTFTDQNHGWAVKTQQPQQNTSQSQSQQTIGGSIQQKPTLPKNTLLHTHDGGKTWQSVAPFPAGMGGSLYFIDEQTGWTTGVDKPGIEIIMSIYITHNGGRTWQKQSLPNTPGKLAMAQQPIFFDKSTGYFLARFDTPNIQWYAYTTHDGGNSWQRSNTAVPSSVRLLVDDQHAIGATLDQKSDLKDIFILNLTDNRTVSTSPNRNGTLIDYSFPTVRVGFVFKQTSSSAIDLYKTIDGGKTWFKVSTLPKAA
ncbi:WD40/YVTN/BNR-like repeat-containing protein [Ktedonobacter robiniae]|uniref:Photosynthesis system II assembly factor Ycf48/Hcf136-like domain-containing protein n=1 Tax=Ktedonobacter robiniae TaxID=2778365 RepID=A0ABQ3V7E0_9CHLR|nr:hypothetical protein [Ktedonobacter robiniae]GHO60983.1 hypothetical protein KSB_94580 [Ktedonobacter robiniae]